MIARLLVMVCLMALSVPGFAQVERTKGMAIFADATFTSSEYGKYLIKECLNLRSFVDTKRMDYYSVPGGEVVDLVQDTRMVDPIQYAQMSFDKPNVKTKFEKSNSYDPRASYHHHLMDKSTDRIMVFMGVNEVEKQSGQNWLVLANEIKSYGKQCMIGLPHLVGDDEQQLKIIRYNQKVAELLKGSDCQIIDPSYTISKGLKGIAFGKSAGLTMPDHHLYRGAQATCNAINRVMNPKAEDKYSELIANKDTPAATIDENKREEVKTVEKKAEKPVLSTEVNKSQETEKETVDKNNNGYCGDTDMAMFEADCHADSSY